MSLIILEHGVMPYLEEDSIVEFLMYHGGVGAYAAARVEHLGFEDSNPKDM